jgi:rhodanese-related sulfurtransferase
MNHRLSKAPHITRKALVTIVAMGAVASLGAFVQNSTIGMNESAIRRMAMEKPLPLYPAESVRRGTTGVAVAAVLSNADHRVSDVTILEAPDAAIGDAVRVSLLKWRIEPTTVVGESVVRGLRGKITFYFRIVDGKGRVFHPEEVPGGPQPEPQAGPPPGGPGTTRPGTAGPPQAGARPAAVSHEVPADLEIDEAQLRTLMASAQVAILDVRERDDFTRQHRPGAINIPDNELAVRAYIEVDRQRPVVIPRALMATCGRFHAGLFFLASFFFS